VLAQSGLKVQYRAADTNASDNQMKPHFNIVNGSTASVNMSELKIRYYFTKDAGGSMVFWCDWAMKGCGNLSGAFLAGSGTNTDTILEVSFTSGAGAIAAGQSSGEMQIRLSKSDWANFNESNDYSFDATKTAFADWDRVVLLRNGSVVWGTAPGGVVVPTNTPGGSTVVPTRTNTRTGPTATRTRTNTPGGPTATRTRTPVPPTRTNTPVSPTRTNTPVGPTVPPPTRTPTRVGPTPTNPPAGTHLANPFVGANIYINPDYAASVTASAGRNPSLAAKMNVVANTPTFIWLDSIDAVNGTNGYGHSLLGYLQDAAAKGKNAVQIVVYDLPGRDCAALASNGELPLTQAGFDRYKTEYIDPIYNAIVQFPQLRVIAVIEPDSLPNLTTNTSDAECAQAASQPYGYRPATQYTLNKLSALSHFYAYIDIGHHGWLGWSSNLGPAVTLIGDTIKGTTRGVNSIDGYISATANSIVVDEPFHDITDTVNGTSVRQSRWHDWNDYADEATYDVAWRNAMISAGFPSGIGMLIDTSRNGWGGPNRPTARSTSTDVNTFVDQSRIDRRIHKGNWCNQSGAGIGIRPTVNPAAGFDAYVWVKPPGESDGSSSLIPTGPDNPGGKGFDRMCDPTYTGNSLNGNNMSGALPGAPVSGRWFEAQFVQLVTNAYPPL
jgi:cellulose 1,4-beta-cellobiosidase